MPFVRKKRGLVLVVHNHREGDKVVQRVLHGFGAREELAATLERSGWSGWREQMAWQHPGYRWDWPRLRRRLAEELERWQQAPAGAVARRGSRVLQLAGDLDAALRPLSPARRADRSVLDGAHEPLATLRDTLERLLAPNAGRTGAGGEASAPAAEASTARGGGRGGQAVAEAERLFDEGMEHWWAGDRPRACRFYRRALKLQPDHADAHNHLGIYEFERGRLAPAERHYLAAIAAADRDVISEAGRIDWGHLENRSYLRPLANLGRLKQRRGLHDEAAEIFERMLRLNPGDNQGVRWLLGECYHRQGRLEEAVAAYEAGADEPGCCYGLALALHELGEPRAGLALVRAFAANRYVPPMLLGERWRRVDGWHGSNMQEPEWAADTVAAQGDLWRRADGSAELLRRFWTAGPVREWLAALDEVTRALQGEPPGDQRSQLVSQRFGLISEATTRVVAAEVDPEAIGIWRPTKPPRQASLDQVRITRKPGCAVIEHADETVGTINLRLEDAEAMSDAQVIAAYNDVVAAMERMRAEHEHVAVEVPPGSAQIAFSPLSQQWVARGDVLRCLIHDDEDRRAVIQIDERMLSQEELGGLLTTHAGWGMRIVFVPDDELNDEPTIEVREPDDEDRGATGALLRD